MSVLRTGLLALILQVASAQEPAPAFVEGVVVKLRSNEPLPKASVELRGAGATLATTTDAEGKFFFPSVRPGQYRLISSRAGYIETEYGQRQRLDVFRSPMISMPPALTLAGGQRMGSLRIEMTPGGIISGRVLVSGKPVGNVDVRAMVASYELGQRVMTNVLSTRTDDLGEYRIFWLPPGKYYVAADVLELQAAANSQTVTTGLDPSYNPLSLNSMPMRFVISRAIGAGGTDTTMFGSFYPPGTPDWRISTPVEVGPGVEARGVDIQVNPLPALHVRGVVTGIPAATGGQLVLPTVSLLALDNANPTATVPAAPTDRNGVFDLSRVSPGSYVLSATVRNLIGRISIDVRDRDLNGVALALVPGLTVSGRIIIEGAAANVPDRRISELRISLLDELTVGGFRQNNRTASASLVTPQADGSFTIPSSPANAGVPPGNYRVLVGPILTAAAGWASPPAALPAAVMPTAVIPSALASAYVKSIRIGEIDVLNDGLHLSSEPREPLVIVVGTNPGSLEGRVLNRDRQPAVASTIVLIPESGLQFKINHKFTSTDAFGRFQIPNIAPGDYTLFAWEDIEAGMWQDPDFVRSERERGVRIHVGEGQKQTAMELVAVTAGR